MDRGGFGVLLVAAAMSSVSLLAAPTVAYSASYPEPLEVKASNGYSLMAWGIPAEDGRRASLLLLVRRAGAEVSYMAPAEVTESSIEADLGGLGEIDVSFHPSGRTKIEHSPCGGKAAKFEPDIYEGIIDFRGEDGYTELHASHAEGNGRFFSEILCPSIVGPSGTGPNVPGAGLRVGPRTPQWLGIRLGVHKNRPGDRSFFSATIDERQGELSIERSVNVRGPASAFEYGPPLEKAIVRPPAPFSGWARFDRDTSPAERWVGTLTADFPGRSRVPLTAGALQANLFRGEWANAHDSPPGD